MKPNKEMAGVGLAFVGFAVIVLGFRGTWGKVWHDLFGGGVSANTAGLSPGTFSNAPHVDPGAPSEAPVPAGPGIGNSPFWLYPNLPSTPNPAAGSHPGSSQNVGYLLPNGYRLPGTFTATPSGVLT